MLNLAQVKKNLISGETELQLLARQKSDCVWEISQSEALPLDQSNCLSEGLLVLVDLGEENRILSITEAKDWVLGLVKQYLTNSAITPEFVKQEQAKIEQWRQEIASKSQDLTRRYLEIETRREQLQELEETLTREKEKLALKMKNNN
jgi:hypothetical protein